MNTNYFFQEGSKAANDDLQVTFEDFCKIVSEKQDLVLQTSQRTKIFDYLSNKVNMIQISRKRPYFPVLIALLSYIIK